MKHKRAWFYLVIWKDWTYEYYETKLFNKLKGNGIQYLEKEIAFTKKVRKAYKGDYGIKVPVNYTARSI